MSPVPRQLLRPVARVYEDTMSIETDQPGITFTPPAPESTPPPRRHMDARVLASRIIAIAEGWLSADATDGMTPEQYAAEEARALVEIRRQTREYMGWGRQ